MFWCNSGGIAAASVLAKEARDALIRRLAQRFPGYGLDSHAGYGTARHRQALMAEGPTPLHRRSFLRNIGTRFWWIERGKLQEYDSPEPFLRAEMETG